MVIVDVRTTQERMGGHVCDSIFVETPPPPLSLLQRRVLRRRLGSALATVNKSQPVYVYCKKGVRAALAERELQSLGFVDVRSLGGVELEAFRQLVDTGQLSWC